MSKYRVRFSDKGYYIQRKISWLSVWEELINTWDRNITYFNTDNGAKLKIKDLIEKDKMKEISKDKDKNIKRKTYRG